MVLFALEVRKLKVDNWKLKIKYPYLSSFSIFHFQFSIASLWLAWWRWWDSNPWPPACRAGALPAELHPQINLVSSCFLHRFSFCILHFAFCIQSLEWISPLHDCVSTELSSRTVARKVFSPLQSLTSVFGMGTGGPSAFVALTLSVTLRHWILNNNPFLFWISPSNRS